MWPARTAVKQAARVARNKYLCAGCGQIVPHKAISIDHVSPVVDPQTGFTSWDDYVSRLFCDASNLQALCKACHHQKSQGEQKVRLARKQAETRKRAEKQPKAKKAAKKRKQTKRARKAPNKGEPGSLD